VALGIGVDVCSGVEGEGTVDSSKDAGFAGAVAVDAAPPPHDADNATTDKEAISNNLMIM
jgi:hypothetical protein